MTRNLSILQHTGILKSFQRYISDLVLFNFSYQEKISDFSIVGWKKCNDFHWKSRGFKNSHYIGEKEHPLRLDDRINTKMTIKSADT